MLLTTFNIHAIGATNKTCSFFGPICHFSIPCCATVFVFVFALSSPACHSPAPGHYDGDWTKIAVIYDAAESGDLEKIKALLKDDPDLVFSKCSPQVATCSGRTADDTPLCVAAKYGHKDVAQLLLAKEAEVNATCEFDRTPLHLASANGHKDVAELLLANRAEVNAKSSDGWTPLHDAVFWSFTSTGQGTKNSATVAEMDPTTAHQGQRDVAELLLANKADVNAKESNYGYTPLHLAAQGGHKDVAQLLLAKGAEVNAQDMYGFTPLHFAATRNTNQKDMVELLLSKGARRERQVQRRSLTQVSAGGGGGHERGGTRASWRQGQTQ